MLVVKIIDLFNTKTEKYILFLLFVFSLKISER